jgi:excisionase family DNA binding protein
MVEQLLYSTSKDELTEIIKNAVSDSFKIHLSEGKQDKYSEYLTITQASEYLHLATPTLYGFTSKNEIPFLKKGKKLYFKKIDLDNWLSGEKVSTK